MEGKFFDVDTDDGKLGWCSGGVAPCWDCGVVVRAIQGAPVAVGFMTRHPPMHHGRDSMLEKEIGSCWYQMMVPQESFQCLPGLE